MNTPLVSIIIPTFNRPAFLAATLASVTGQDYPAKEIIVVDDGSTTDVETTVDDCKKYGAHYLRQENRGPSAAYNHGAARSNGELLMFLDDDDLCPPGSLRTRVEHWQADPSFHHVVGRLRRFQEEVPGRIEFIDSEEQAALIICSGAEVMMRTAFEQVGGYNESMRMGEDVDLWMRMREAGLRQKFIPEICLHNRMHPGKMTLQSDAQTRSGFIDALRKRMQRDKQNANPQ